MNCLLEHQNVIPFYQTFKNNLHLCADENFIVYLMCHNFFIVALKKEFGN